MSKGTVDNALRRVPASSWMAAADNVMLSKRVLVGAAGTLEEGLALSVGGGAVAGGEDEERAGSSARSSQPVMAAVNIRRSPWSWYTIETLNTFSAAADAPFGYCIAEAMISEDLKMTASENKNVTVMEAESVVSMPLRASGEASPVVIKTEGGWWLSRKQKEASAEAENSGV